MDRIHVGCKREIGDRRSLWAVLGFITLAGLCAGPAHAQWAVVDVGAITQLVQEVGVLEQQLQTARSALAQAQSEYSAFTGRRGMQHLLAGVRRNYLPENLAQLQQVLAGTSAQYAALTAQIQTLEKANAALTPRALNTLSSAERTLVVAGRENAALLAATSQQALAAASGRFASLQQLVAAMSNAQDPKAELDLQSRIAVEQAMLANEQVKLRELRQVVAGQAALTAEERREEAVADVGNLRTLAPLNLP